MPDKLLQLLPFLVVDSGGGGRPRLNTARLLEIGFIVGFLWYKLDGIDKHVALLDARLFEHIARSIP